MGAKVEGQRLHWVPCNQGCGRVVAVAPEWVAGGATCRACDEAWVPPGRGVALRVAAKPVKVAGSWIDGYYGN